MLYQYERQYTMVRVIFVWREMFVYGYVQFSLLRDLMIFYMAMVLNGKLLYRKESPSKISMKLKAIEREIPLKTPSMTYK